MSMEFIYRGITEFNEPGLIVVFETNPDNPIRDAAAFVWNLEKLKREKKLQIVFTSPQVLDQGVAFTGQTVDGDRERNRCSADFRRWHWPVDSELDQRSCTIADLLPRGQIRAGLLWDPVYLKCFFKSSRESGLRDASE
jgi:KaiC